MNNLAALFDMQGRPEKLAFWKKQITQYQQSNPYFHAALGDRASENADWLLALEHYQRALALDSKDRHLIYAMGLIYYHLEEFDKASRWINKAIELATLHSEVEEYKVQLELVKGKQVVL